MFAHNSSLSSSVLNFLIVFAFTWIMIYTFEPEWVKNNSVFSKKKAVWYSFAISILIVLILWLLYAFLNWHETRSRLSAMIIALSGENGTVSKKDIKTIEREIRRTKGNSPLEKLQNLLI